MPGAGPAREDGDGPARAISEKTASELVDRVFAEVVEEGTAKHGRLDGFGAAGKTGTAQKYDDALKAYTQQVHGLVRRLHAARRPRLSMIVVLDEPKEGYYGGQVCAPVFKDIARQVLRYLRVPPERPLPPKVLTAEAEKEEEAVKLQDVLEGIPVVAGRGAESVEITGIAYNSKAVKPGFLFAALPGAARNGMDFVAEAVGNGAAAVLSAWPKPPAVDTAWVQAADAREALALAAANFYGHPSDRMKVVGVTGTKGKTTTTFVLEEILRAAGAAPGLIGTIEYRRPGWKMDAPRTTPESSDLQALLRDFLDAGVSHCVMEVSSHALEQKRVWGVSYDVAVFTNLSGEHLDYHPTMEAYFEAKKKLFFLNHKKSAAVVNWDDPWGQKLVAELPMTTVTFGLEPAAIVRALKYVPCENGHRRPGHLSGRRDARSSRPSSAGTTSTTSWPRSARPWRSTSPRPTSSRASPPSRACRGASSASRTGAASRSSSITPTRTAPSKAC